jgi:hypothetical protein
MNEALTKNFPDLDSLPAHIWHPQEICLLPHKLIFYWRLVCGSVPLVIMFPSSYTITANILPNTHKQSIFWASRNHLQFHEQTSIGPMINTLVFRSISGIHCNTGAWEIWSMITRTFRALLLILLCLSQEVFPNMLQSLSEWRCLTIHLNCGWVWARKYYLNHVNCEIHFRTSWSTLIMVSLVNQP